MMKLWIYSFLSPFLRFSLFRGILIIFVFLCILSISYIKIIPNISVWNLIFTTDEDVSCMANETTVSSLPLILLWTTHYSEKNWIPSLPSLNCPVDCQITTDKRHLKKSAAVLFYLKSIIINDLPSCNEYGNQKWVLFNGEAQPNTPSEVLRAMEGKIHWTATHRRDSEFYAPYGVLVPANATQVPPELDGSRNKSSLVCWIVSHCHTSSQRESYVDALAKYVPIAIYGWCGTETCPNSDAKHCYSYISKKCKFYLSFENSICPDYSTEKLFYALETDMVPIVMGGDNYSLTLPAHSYINALDFPNPKDLATFLLELNNDPEEYKKYHTWKAKYKVVDLGYKWACDLCQRLHNDSDTSVSLYKNLWSWWFNPKCYTWTEIIKDH